jgi:NitT/TauT family transport system substrate-binding protein
VIWPVDEIGAPRYHGYLLGTREETVEREPELARAFLAATARGFATAASDTAATRAVLERVLPYFPRQVIAESLRLIAPTWTHDGHWGVQRDELIGPYATWLAEHGVLGSAEAAIDATTNELLPEGPA